MSEQELEFKTGMIVNTRGRDWIVLPSEDKDLLRLKPLDGNEEDCVGIYMPLKIQRDAVKPAQFGLPTIDDLGNARSAKLLYDASRLTLRNAAGPFRCAAKLSFRPRSYQMVPLIMALKQEGPIRLLIADDVGIGKTVEALLIAKELLERREIKRFAVLCPPHLCEQWQTELKDKFNIDAVIIRGSTQAALERAKPEDDNSIFKYYPYQIISIDYIKFDNHNRKDRFVQDAPELLIVDEAHTCARPAGAYKSQQLRYSVLSDLTNPEAGRNVILMTATPHSGKDEEFKSLLGLLNPKFEEGDWSQSDFLKTELAKHFIQRKRGNITKWMDENTPFPERKQVQSGDNYVLSTAYQSLYDEVLQIASELMQSVEGSKNQRFRYWTALAFLRGIMSSPAAGAKMFSRKIENIETDDEDFETGDTSNPLFEKLETSDDELPTNLAQRAQLKTSQKQKFSNFVDTLNGLQGFTYDFKLLGCYRIIEQWIKKGISPVIFCRYIETAHYVYDNLKEKIGNKVVIDCITSESPDDDRKERVLLMKPEEGDKKPRILVATDCLSEGINLQDIFDAVFHYDLPWNPNRLEQREGRVDRFGQIKSEVHTCLFYGKDNPMDQTVLKILYEKANNIKKDIGVSVPFPENSKEFMDTIFQAILNEARKKQEKDNYQGSLFEIDEIVRCENAVNSIFEETKKKQEALHSLLAHDSIKAQEIEQDLKRTDEAVGKPEVVYSFVHDSMQELFGNNSKMDNKEYTLNFAGLNIPEQMQKFYRVKKTDYKTIAFKAPTPEHTIYWGRNSDAVEYLCQKVLSDSLHHGKNNVSVARAAVTSSKAVQERTVIYVLRARHVIRNQRVNVPDLVAEEILTRGYKTMSKALLTEEEVNELMSNPQPGKDLAIELQQKQLERELSQIEDKREEFNSYALERAELLIAEHERYYKVLGDKKKSERFKVVEPVIPLDVLGIYIFLPEAK